MPGLPKLIKKNQDQFLSPIYGIECDEHALDCHLNQIYLLQKAALRIILKIQPWGHVSTYFKELQMMPIVNTDCKCLFLNTDFNSISQSQYYLRT